MKTKTSYLLGCIFAVFSVLFTVLVKTVDVGSAASLPQTNIGFSTLNNAFHELTGVNMLWYDITDLMGIIAILAGLAFMGYGGILLLKRRSFKKVDRFIYALGGLYVVLGIIYVFFEKVIINYRPIIMPDASEPEASFPSSHTLLICTIAITAGITLFRLFKDKKALATALTAVCVAFALIAVVGRLICGVHWLTDIIASILFSSALIFFYAAASKNVDGKHTARA